MASTIGTLASFATQSMKPAPGEEADAIWAQKVADNTGYLWHKPLSLESRSLFTKTGAHNGIRAMLVGSDADATPRTDYVRVYAAGLVPAADVAPTLAGTMTYTRVNGSQHVMNLDISSLTNGNRYALSHDPYAFRYSHGEVNLVWGTGAPT